LKNLKKDSITMKEATEEKTKRSIKIK